MPEHSDFINSFFRVLNQQGKYAFFDYQLTGSPRLNSIAHYDLLIQPDDLNPVLQQLNAFEEITGLSLTARFSHSQALINFKKGDLLKINFTHRFLYKSLIYLDATEVMACNTFNPFKGYFQPSIEHLFEFAILRHYLRFEGWNEELLAFFRDFHVLIKEDLIDSFNSRYGTFFRDLESIADFDAEARNSIMQRLKALPANQFLNSINVRWHNFMGFVREAKII
ncbi:MAG: hypothetical protein AAGG75_15415 [Bacteroidota bacterium]